MVFFARGTPWEVRKCTAFPKEVFPTLCHHDPNDQCPMRFLCTGIQDKILANRLSPSNKGMDQGEAGNTRILQLPGRRSLGL